MPLYLYSLIYEKSNNAKRWYVVVDTSDVEAASNIEQGQNDTKDITTSEYFSTQAATVVPDQVDPATQNDMDDTGPTSRLAEMLK